MRQTHQDWRAQGSVTQISHEMQPIQQEPKQGGINELLARLQRGDGDTLLLLALLWLLYRDGADRKLLLAILYILL